MAKASTNMDTPPLLMLMFVEEDILTRVFRQLDWKTLQALELTCSNFRQFVIKANIWKKKFEIENPSYLDKSMDMDKRSKIEKLIRKDSKDFHLGYKKLVIKLSNLDSNMMKGIWTRKRTRNLSWQGRGDDEIPHIYDMNCDNYLAGYVSLDDGEDDKLKVFEIKSSKVSELEFNSVDFQIVLAQMLPVTTEKSKFGKIAVLRCSRARENRANIVETFKFDENSQSYRLESKSLPLGESQIGRDVYEVKYASSNCLLLLGKTRDTDVCVSFLTVQEDQLEMALVGTKICMNAYPMDDQIVQHDYLASQYKQELKVYDLKTTNPGKLGDSLIAAMWEKKVIFEDSSAQVYCSTLEFCAPNLLVGRTDGRCEVYNVLQDQHIRTLEHSGGGLNKEYIYDIVCLNDYIFTLTGNKGLTRSHRSGWIFAWEKSKAVSKNAEGEVMLWKKPSGDGAKVWYFSVNNTEIITLEGIRGPPFEEYFVQFDFWDVEKKALSDS